MKKFSKVARHKMAQRNHLHFYILKTKYLKEKQYEKTIKYPGKITKTTRCANKQENVTHNQGKKTQ